MTAEGAKGGFENENAIIESFNRFDSDAVIWLRHMGHNPNKVSKIIAYKAPARVKPDVICEIFDNQGSLVAKEKLSAKKASNSNGFNQIDRGDIQKRYLALWPDMPPLAVEGLRLFTGNLPPLDGSRNPKRMFFDELPLAHQETILDFFSKNKNRVISDLLAGREPDRANWFLGRDVSRNKWTLLPIETAIDFYSAGNVGKTAMGSIKIGGFTAQRKGGDKGLPTATNLQFKFDPNLIGQI